MQLTGPLIVSLPEACTVTSLMYQPCAPSVPALTARLAVGPVLSNLTVREAFAPVFPALSVQWPVNSWPDVSVVWFWSAVQDSIPLVRSLPVV